MQTIDTTQSKTLQFEVDINGVNSSDLNGLLQFVVEDVYYGFPVSISENLIEVEVPPLSSIVKNSLVSDSVIECQLSVYGKGFHLEPWKDKIQIHVPIQMEAKMVSNYNNKDSDDKTLNVTLKEDKKEEIEEVNLDMELSDDVIIEESIESEEYHNSLKDTIKEKSKEDILVENIIEEKTNKEEIKKRKIELMKNIIKEEVYFIKTGKHRKIVKENNDLVKKLRKKVRLNLIEQLKTKQKKKKVIKESSENKDPIVLMESCGMKNEKVQERMLEKAESMGGKDSIYDTLKKLLGV